MDMRLLQPFSDTAKEIFTQMANVNIIPDTEFRAEDDDMAAYGVTSIVNFMGEKIKGRLVIDMEPKLALHLATVILDESHNETKNIMVLYCVSEINNIIAGNANTYLNNTYSLNMRLTPPVVFTGKDIILSIPKISSWSMYCNTEYGKLKINAAFEGGIE